MYKLIALISTIIRLFCLPNPFETLEYGYIINYIVEPMFHLLTYNIVGLYYRRGKAPAVGSFLYLMFYAIHTGLIMFMGSFNWNPIAIIVIFISYFLVHIFSKFF
ncbi:MAG: hypothetical protein PHE29_05800 [Tissierellia bacterium]|nr:hypothetical protein [Tissierellia bacterium]MDD4781147.1 hypothetical protein [Tissierellia bacterium]